MRKLLVILVFCLCGCKDIGQVVTHVHDNQRGGLTVRRASISYDWFQGMIFTDYRSDTIDIASVLEGIREEPMRAVADKGEPAAE